MRQYDMKAEPGEKTVIELKVTESDLHPGLGDRGKRTGKNIGGHSGCAWL